MHFKSFHKWKKVQELDSLTSAVHRFKMTNSQIQSNTLETATFSNAENLRYYFTEQTAFAQL